MKQAFAVLVVYFFFFEFYILNEICMCAILRIYMYINTEVGRGREGKRYGWYNNK